MQKPGGTVKVKTFKASMNIAAAEVTVEPGAIRLNWQKSSPMPSTTARSFLAEVIFSVSLVAYGKPRATFVVPFWELLFR